ncbi:MAG: hypothetical protein DCE90_09200 [Pseudanabaena sp.]|nr:MAG: hypothetical protein DCE90_09200 [Pseudanabaena sp.]
MAQLKNFLRLKTSALFFVKSKYRQGKKNNNLKKSAEFINGYKVERLIRWYEKVGNSLIGERVLKGISLSDLQKLLSEPSDSPMFFTYELTTEQVKYFQQYLEQDFDTNAYDYFLECDAL